MTRRWSLRFLLLWPALFLFGATAWATVRYDMTREELLKEMGKPTSTLKNPATGREVLNFPKGVRIELDKGVVVSVKGLDMAAVEEATKAAAAQKAEAEEAARIEREAEEKIKAAQAAEEARMAQLAAGDSAGAKKSGNQPDEKGGRRRGRDDDGDGSHFLIAAFLGRLVVSWLVMVAALKLTTKYWGVNVDWSGILIAAAAESGTRALLGLIGEYVFHASSLFYLDQIAATIVLVLVLRKVSTNQSLNQAVSIAVGVKVFSLLVSVLLFTLMLNLLH